MPDPSTPCSSPEARQFDFWLGEWDLTWPAEQMGGEEGSLGIGANRIERLFGDCVIEENFATGDGDFLGRSHSVYDPKAGLWLQTWVDSAGGYIALSGGFDGAEMTLATQPVDRDGETRANRMVFADITKDSFVWHWQATADDGASWRELWTIDYRRRA